LGCIRGIHVSLQRFLGVVMPRRSRRGKPVCNPFAKPTAVSTPVCLFAFYVDAAAGELDIPRKVA
jgi:hypothetical protein